MGEGGKATRKGRELTKGNEGNEGGSPMRKMRTFREGRIPLEVCVEWVWHRRFVTSWARWGLPPTPIQRQGFEGRARVRSGLARSGSATGGSPHLFTMLRW